MDRHPPIRLHKPRHGCERLCLVTAESAGWLPRLSDSSKLGAWRLGESCHFNLPSDCWVGSAVGILQGCWPFANNQCSSQSSEDDVACQQARILLWHLLICCLCGSHLRLCKLSHCFLLAANARPYEGASSSVHRRMRVRVPSRLTEQFSTEDNPKFTWLSCHVGNTKPLLLA